MRQQRARELRLWLAFQSGKRAGVSSILAVCRHRLDEPAVWRDSLVWADDGDLELIATAGNDMRLACIVSIGHKSASGMQ